jgi:HAD superfamily hydrolase (TIGR01490 family)
MSVYDQRNRRNGRVGKRAAFYDLDGTLMGLNLVHGTLFAFTNIGEWSGRVSYVLGLAARLPMLYLAERRDRHLLNVTLFEMFKGISRDRLMTLGEEYCDRVLMDNMYPRAIEMVAANREAGLEPVLVTGSPDFIVAPLAQRLGIETYAANRLVYSRGLATGRLHNPVMAGEAKAAWCAEYAAANRISLGASWGYADSHYDLPFLAALGHPVAVNPDRRLLAMARSRQWPIVRFDKAAGTVRGTGGIGPEAVEEWLERKSNGAARG